MTKLFNYHKIRRSPFIISDRRQSKTLCTIDERGSQIARNSVFDCHLSPVGRQTAIKNTVSNDPRYTFVVSSINVSDCRLSEVLIEYRPTEYKLHVPVEKKFPHRICGIENSRRTIDERGSEIATTSVLNCRLSPVGRLMAIENCFFLFLVQRSSIILTFSTAAYPV